jgi:hypothetical protein
MLKKSRINKSVLILYYMRERIKEKNISVKYLVITNIYEWFIYSSADFEKLFAGSKNLRNNLLTLKAGDCQALLLTFSIKTYPDR